MDFSIKSLLLEKTLIEIHFAVNECLSIIDDEKNNNAPRGAESKISADDSKIEVYVLPTNEELILARDTCRVVLNAPTP